MTATARAGVRRPQHRTVLLSAWATTWPSSSRAGTALDGRDRCGRGSARGSVGGGRGRPRGGRGTRGPGGQSPAVHVLQRRPVLLPPGRRRAVTGRHGAVAWVAGVIPAGLMTLLIEQLRSRPVGGRGAHRGRPGARWHGADRPAAGGDQVRRGRTTWPLLRAAGITARGREPGRRVEAKGERYAAMRSSSTSSVTCNDSKVRQVMPSRDGDPLGRIAGAWCSEIEARADRRPSTCSWRST